MAKHAPVIFQSQIPSDDLNNLVQDIIAQAKRKGASACEVAGSIDKGLSANVRMREVDIVEFHKSKNLGVTIFKGKKKGSVSTTDFSSQAIEEAIESAFQIAKYAEEDPFAGLADPNLMQKNPPFLDLYHPYEVTAEEAIQRAIQCESFALDYHTDIINSDGASFSASQHYGVYGNSHGFLGSYPTSRYSMSCVVIGKRQNEMQRDYDYTIARDLMDLENEKTIGIQAAKKTIERLGSKKIKTGQYPILFQAKSAASLFGHFISAISGGSLYRKASFLLDMLNKPVFSELVDIKELPHILKGLGSAPFDSEGVATRPRTLVDQGVLRGYVLSSYSARKLNMQTTGNAGGVHNLTIQPGEDDFNALVARLDTGLIVTELMGHGTNIVTGNYSRGAAGFWVEGGKIQYPVEEITIAGNLKDMYKGIQAIGSDVDMRGNIRTGSVLIDRMTIAGN